MRLRKTFIVAGLLSATLAPEQPRASEVCGNGQDDDANGRTDEGCQSPRVTGVHESPLPSSATGMVSPKTGQLVYPEPPDLSFPTPFGPALQFQRTFLSQYEPYGSGYPTPVDYRAPLGEGWHHNFMAWVSNRGFDEDDIVVHLVTGQDVRVTYASTDGTYNYYSAQAGHHVDYVRERVASPSIWEVRTLDGTLYSYEEQDHAIWKLRSIADGLGQKLTVTYYQSGGAFGQIDKVVDASGRMELRFFYGTSGARSLTSVEYWNAGSKHAWVTFPNSLTPTWAERGDERFRNYTYDANGKLQTVADGNATMTTIAQFSYKLTPPYGRTARIHTGQGALGYDYGTSSCNSGSGTYIYSNIQGNVTCIGDADCGSGEFCGGRTNGYDIFGTCYRARRCAAWVSGNEDMVGAVTSSCPTCTQTADRVWDTTNVELDGDKSADNVWTSYAYNADGLVIKIVENDTDAVASTIPAGARVTYFKYNNSSYPGLVTEVRRLSELKPGGTCTSGTTTDCKRTIYSYSAGGQISLQREIGFTLDSTGAVVSYDFTTNYVRDGNGRLTKVTGPRTDTTYDELILEYYLDSDPDLFQAGRLRYQKRKLAASTFITTAFADYDEWGLPTEIIDPNNKLTCDTRGGRGLAGVLVKRRIAMSGQTSCTTTDASDLVTSYDYDSDIRTTKVTRSIGNCVHYEYDARGRISKIKERDDCVAASAGDTQEFTYSDDSLVLKVEYKDASGTVTYRRETTYGADRRLLEVLNPSDPSKKRTYSYEADGMIDTIVGEEGVGKTEWAYDNLNRVDLEKRYTASSASDDWNLLPGVQLDLPFEVEDEDGKAIEWTWDDMGRKVKQITPENGTNIFVYDKASNLVTHVEASGSADQKTHTFTYDPQNRITAENYGDAACFTLGGAEIQYTYDTPGGCPTGTCVNSSGRLAYVKTKITCDDAKSDDTFDQLTYFGYDDAGRIVKETIQDDGGREAIQNYTWDENGHVTAVETPSGVDMKWTYGGGGNSDGNKIVSLIRNAGSDTPLTTGGTWHPFGPIKGYTQANTITGNSVVASFTSDLAYRTTQLQWSAGGTDIFKIAHTLDAQGRITARDFSATTLADLYYLYDWQNRITCESTVAPTGGTCPTGTSSRNRLTGLPPYTASSDRVSLYHYMSGWGNDTYTYNYVTGSDAIDAIPKGGGTYSIDLAWDGRGNRLYDDDAQWADDRRDYTYDARNNLITVSGQMFISSTVLHDYTITNAYDHKNRRIFKSLLDEDDSIESQWFFYYDLSDRLIEVHYTPDIASPTTYQLFQFYWIGSRPVAWFQTTYPAATVTRRFVHADHLDTPLDGWSWPTSGDSTRIWLYNPDAFGFGDTAIGHSIYMPLRFPGQHCDTETKAFRWNGSTAFVKARPALNDNRYRTYDPLTGTYLQVDPFVGKTWNAYEYAVSNPVMHTDEDGRIIDNPNTPEIEYCIPGWGGFDDVLVDNPWDDAWDDPLTDRPGWPIWELPPVFPPGGPGIVEICESLESEFFQCANYSCNEIDLHDRMLEWDDCRGAMDPYLCIETRYGVDARRAVECMNDMCRKEWLDYEINCSYEVRERRGPRPGRSILEGIRGALRR